MRNINLMRQGMEAAAHRQINYELRITILAEDYSGQPGASAAAEAGAMTIIEERKLPEL
jgi:hypothetical protein